MTSRSHVWTRDSSTFMQICARKCGAKRRDVYFEGPQDCPLFPEHPDFEIQKEVLADELEGFEAEGLKIDRRPYCT